MYNKYDFNDKKIISPLECINDLRNCRSEVKAHLVHIMTARLRRLWSENKTSDALTMGIGGTKSFASVTAVRFLLGTRRTSMVQIRARNTLGFTQLQGTIFAF
ncbi:hypothetical protein B0H10DRAFT_1961810 [Mycena sp. CBHHK59/15]|nr:hypothetical protein B0H10DRAFT_1961810 [Mycena sp. CBHHK59/15]